MLETERLILRPMTEADTDDVYRMRGDADVMRFIREPQTRAESADWVKLISSRWQPERIGFCAMIEKSSGEFAGWCGLWRLQETFEIEVGYAVAGKFQRRGFASEAALRFLEYGFAELRLEKIVAVARPENAASRAVMKRIGMRYDYTGEFYGRELVHYSITKEAFKQDGQDRQDI